MFLLFSLCEHSASHIAAHGHMDILHAHVGLMSWMHVHTRTQRLKPQWLGVADVNAAVFHSLGLFIAHAVYVISMHSEKRAHSVKAGPGATVNSKATVLWAALQVGNHIGLSIDIV